MVGSLIATFLLAFAPIKVESRHSFSVKVTGQGPSIILIPGLMCSGDVWNATVEHLKSRYTCHVLTLPGFAGVAPISDPMLRTVRDEIETYVTDNKLERPVLIGHSLGGMLSLWLASDKPSMFGGVLSVDGVPYLGALNDAKQTPALLQPTVSTLTAYYKSMNPSRLAAANSQSLPHLMTSAESVAMVSLGANKSDPASVGEAFAEMLQTDLRPDMGKITIPVLLIIPDGNGDNPDLESLKSKYELQVASIQQRQIVIAPKSLHFVMLDAPTFFLDRVDDFLLRSPHRG